MRILRGLRKYDVSMRVERWLPVVASCVFVTACVDSNAIVCGDNICPGDSRCDVESGLCIPKDCGDGELTGIEECDGEKLGGRDCTHYGYYTPGDLKCSVVCTFIEQSCEGAGICGDHIVNGGEACDGTPRAGEACTDYGFDTGRLGCSDACSPGFAHCQDVGWVTVGGDLVTPVRSVWGASESDAFAVGDFGLVLHFDGTAWTRMASPVSVELNSVWGSSGSDVFAVGREGVIIHYNGSAWTQMTSNTTEQLFAVWGRSGSEVYAVGDRGTIAQFDGSAWNITLLPPHDLHGVYGNADRVFAVGPATGQNAALARILRKEGTGAWTVETPPAVPTLTKYSLHAIWGTGDNFIAVGGEFSQNSGTTVMLTFDGNTWTPFLPGTLGELRAVWGATPTDVIVAGFNGLMLRFDGTSARKILTSSPRQFSGLWGTSSDHVYVTSGAGTVLASNGVEWRAPVTRGNPNEALRDAWRFSNGDLMLVGHQSQLVTIEAGVESSLVVGTDDLQAVWTSGTTPLNGHTFVVTEGDGVWHRAPNGSFVQEITNGIFDDVWGTSADNVYASGGNASSPALMRYNGATWSSVTLPAGFGSRLFGVWASGPSDVWAVGARGVAIHSTDGVTFVSVPTGVDPSINLRSVWGSGPNDVFAVGDNNVIIHYDGTRWRSMSFVGSEVLLSVEGTGPNDVFAGGTGGILHYNGVSWARVEMPVQMNITGMTVAEETVVLIGNFGAVIQLDRSCQSSETACDDRWDNDCDGLVNCADPECTGDAACARGGACDVETITLGCNESRRGTTYTGISLRDEWPCVAPSTAGSEVTYRFIGPAAGQVTFTLEDVDGNAELLVLGADEVDSACDVSSCTYGANGTLTTTASSTPLYVVVDSVLGDGAEFTLTTSCN